MYCGSCLHDNTLAAALLELGEDVLLVPTYTPLRTDEVDVSIRRVFFGGMNVYLQQRFELISPHAGVARSAARPPGRVGSRGSTWREHRSGRIGRDDRLDAARRSGPPAERAGQAGRLAAGRRATRRRASFQLDADRHGADAASADGPPFVCQLSGEDLFLEKLVPPHYEDARGLLRQREADVDAFVALNRYYADFMADYLAVERSESTRHSARPATRRTRATHREAGTRAARDRVPGPHL